ncbi:Glycosyl transferase group 1 [Ignavibacterium album JCM 16511]|uniref:Glycosyl transferase group 1 n=1 Tax=Ignavibacterium album (strain DSM 19864 / JCM 16511 / NBRC 101810 / Mat9-16) TaxID=945713 RepID=I0ANM6_IGNAJ|nr:glycosyltransferase [Ignavibacterium album]AFH50583.1 Glycosyl transferase group 1 [Ignavibacterium album JCM 16511]
MKKVLFITYYWPPSEKASLHWPLDIMNHIQKFGWQPIVLTTKDETFTQKDESLLRKVNPDWLVIKAKAIEPFNLYRRFIGKKPDEKLIASETISLENKSLAHKISIWIRMNLFIPDARIGWYLPAVREASKFLSREKIDAIVSIGPPHTTHLVAKKLSCKFGIPFFPVFIDPWVDIAYYRNFKRNKLTLFIDNYLEKSVIEKSAKVIFVTQSMKEDYLNKYPQIKDKSYVLYWGYNEDDFRSLPLNPLPKEGDFLNFKVIVHAGNIFDYQNPEMLWKEVAVRVKQGEKFKIRFIGTVSPLIKQSIRNYGLESITEYVGFLPYKEMLTELFKADYLLVCATEKRHVPGKLFEYIRIGKPIIAFGNDNKEVEDILTQSGLGKLFRYDEEAKEIFENEMQREINTEKVKQFDRRVIAEELVRILDN